MSVRVTVVVIAKAPMPGRSKTRLCPPCTPQQAALLAEAALEDTLATVMATPAAQPVLALEGMPGPWLPTGFPVIPQRGGGLAERLSAAVNDVGGPAIVIGMDTPQLSVHRLGTAVERLLSPDVDAVLGPAVDGGWWGIGLRRPDPRVFLGIPMSTSGTLGAQRARLRQLDLSVDELPTMVDVDHFEDARTVAALIPASRFADAVASLGLAEHEVPA